MKNLFSAVFAVCLLLASGILAAAPPFGATDAYIEGELSILHADYKDSLSEYIYQVKDKDSGEYFTLNFDRTPPHTMHTGDSLSVHGKMLDKHLWVQDITILKAVSQEPVASAAVVEAAIPRNALYMVVNYS